MKKTIRLTESELFKVINKIINEYGADSGGQDMTWGMYNRPTSKKDKGNQDFIEHGYNDYYDDVPFDSSPYESGKNKYYGGADLSKLWQLGWKKAEAEDKGIEFIEDEPDVKNWDDQAGDYDEANLNETESSVKKGDILYHKNSGATLKVTGVDGITVNMKVTKVKEDGPKYIKVGQPSKTNLANIGKTYTKK